MNFTKLAQLLLLATVYFVPYFSSGQSFELDEYNHQQLLDNSRGNQDSVLMFALRLEHSQDQCRRLFGRYAASTYYYKKGDYKRCTRGLNSILQDIETNHFPESFRYSKKMIGRNYEECLDVIRLNVYRRFFYVRKNQGKYTEALDFLLKRKAIVDSLPQKNTYQIRNKISVERDLAGLHRSLGKPHKSISILMTAQKELAQIELDSSDIFFQNFQVEKVHFQVEIGANYRSMISEENHYGDSAHYYFDQAYLLSQQIDSTDLNFKLSHYIRKSYLYSEQGQFEKSLQTALLAEKFYADQREKISILDLKAMCYSNLNQPESAINYAKRYIAHASRKTLPFWSLVDMHNLLAVNYFRAKKMDSAYRYSQLTLSLIENGRSEQIKTGDRIKELEIEGYRKLNTAIKKKRQTDQRNFTITWTVSGVLFFVFIGFYVKRRKTHQKQLQALESQFQALVKNENDQRLVQKKEIPEETSQSKPLVAKTQEIDNKVTEQLLMRLDQVENSKLFLNENFNLYALAKLLKTNTTYLSKVINQEKGKSFSHYLAELRINYLLQALNQNLTLRKYSIEALGKMIGYANPSSFTRTFKKHMGITPSQYLKTHF